MYGQNISTLPTSGGLSSNILDLLLLGGVSPRTMTRNHILYANVHNRGDVDLDGQNGILNVEPPVLNHSELSRGGVPGHILYSPAAGVKRVVLRWTINTL